MQSVAVLNTAARSRWNPRRNLTNLLLLGADVVALLTAWGCAVLTSVALGQADQATGLSQLWPLAFVVLGIFVVADLYPGAGVSPVDELRLIFTTVGGLTAVVMTSFVLVGEAHGHEMWPLGAGAFVAMVSLSTNRVLTRHLLAHTAWWGVPVYIMGAGRTAALVIDRLLKQPTLNLKPIACFDDDVRKIGSSVGGVPVAGAIQDALNGEYARHSSYVIVAMPGIAPERTASLVAQLGRAFAKVVVIPNAFGLSSVGVGTRDSGGLVGFYFRGHLSLRRNLILKRILDLVLLGPLGALALPVIALSAAAVFVISPGNPFFSQEREGFSGRKIKVWKLRTMRRDAEQVLRAHLANDAAARLEWETRFKLVNDPRIIRVVGRLFRRLSIDELPQLWNIAKGELSLVGPRPFPYYHLERFDPAFRELRASVVPGLTGYWQVTSRSTADLGAQAELDSYYIVNWSVWIDLYVIIRTPWAVLFGVGAY